MYMDIDEARSDPKVVRANYMILFLSRDGIRWRDFDYFVINEYEVMQRYELIWRDNRSTRDYRSHI